MTDYNLSDAEKMVLEVLDLQEYKSQRQLVKEVNIYNHSMPKILIRLKDKGLADCRVTDKTHYWFAL